MNKDTTELKQGVEEMQSICLAINEGCKPCSIHVEQHLESLRLVNNLYTTVKSQQQTIDRLAGALEQCSDVLGNMDDDENYCSSNDYINAVYFTKQALTDCGIEKGGE